MIRFSAAVRVIGRLQEAGYDAYLVGGAVRDLLLGREPKDYDLATAATPEQVKAVFGRRARTIGRRFRLTHVYAEHTVFEVSTFRREPTLEERRGRTTDSGLMVWRDNVYGTLEEDARRRDFTINAVYYDPLNNAHQVIDYVGGLPDMEARVVRMIGDPAIRMAEDPVRMLRALKLVGQYGFTLEDGVRQAIAGGAPQIRLCSQARLLEELYKILKKPYCLPIFTACQEMGLLRHLVPQVGDGWDAPAGVQVRRLLGMRDELLARNEVFASRVTGMCVLILPFVAAACGAPEDAPLWRNSAGIDGHLQGLVRDFLSPYNVPRHMVAKIRDTLLLQPKFMDGRNRKRTLRHPEYDRARDLFGVWVPALLPDQTERLAAWPPRMSHHRSEPEE